MKTKYLFMAAIGALTLVSCADESFVGDQKLLEGATDAPIGFNLSTAYATRADKTGSAAATDLGNRFIVWGEKSETNQNAPASGHLVFQNYQVNYGANTAYTTTSNTKDWEYVGYGHSKKHHDNITTKDGTDPAEAALKLMQTIKYWDYAASNYVFTAVSADSTDINNDYVTIQKNVSGSSVHEKGYKLTLTANAHPEKIFIADRQVITPSAGTDRNATNAYGGNVTLRFRNLLSHVRVGMYETIPGHKVTIKKFYYVNNAAPTFPTMLTEGTDKFYANVPNVATTSAATLTVTYLSSGTTENQPTIAISDATTANYIALGGADASSTGLKANADLKTTANDPTFNETSGEYTAVFPQEANAKTLKLKVDYTLTADGTGETIDVNGATAEIPAEYLQWKPNYKYTYLFKISDNTNGSTGQGVVGLYPITFDAVEVIAEDGKAEYITTLSEPSITTLGVKGDAYSVGQNEYAATTDVYATVVDGGSVVALTKSSNIWLYTVTGTGITEAAVAERLIEAPAMNAAQITVANAKTNPTDVTTGSLTIQNTVPMEDKVTNDKTVGTNMVAKFTTTASTKYAIVYQKTAPTYYVSTGAKYADAAAFTAAQTAAVGGKLYSDETCETEAAAYGDASTTYYQINGKTYADIAAFNAAGQLYKDAALTELADAEYYGSNQGATYYKPSRVKTKGVVVVKVVNCP